MKANNFVFRVDSSIDIGSGHLMRCLTLAKGLREEGAICSFICRELDGNLNHLVSLEEFFLEELPPPVEDSIHTGKKELAHSDWLVVDWKIDAQETSNILSLLNPDWLVVDHYALWEDWEKNIYNNDFKIMVIDDLADRNHYCNLLLDQNLGSNSLLYEDLVPEESKKFFGPKYALLRPEFYDNRLPSLKRREEGNLRNILINFGGGDSQNYIPSILRALLDIELPQEVIISIILGGIGQVTDEHKLLISQFRNEIKIYGMVNNMSEFLLETDLAIGAAGSSSWERCCLGVPSIVFSLSYNQNKIAEQLSDTGAAVYLEKHDLDNKKFSLLLNKLMKGKKLKEISDRASNICDGRGLDRIINELRS